MLNPPPNNLVSNDDPNVPSSIAADPDHPRRPVSPRFDRAAADDADAARAAFAATTAY